MDSVSLWLVVLLVMGAYAIGLFIGQWFKSHRAVQVANNLVIASFVVTLDDTYGVEFRKDLIEEVAKAMETEDFEITKLAAIMTQFQDSEQS